MRAIFCMISVIVLVACTDSEVEKVMDERIPKDTEISDSGVEDTEKVKDSEIPDTEVEDSDVEDTETPDSEVEDSGVEDSESCVFAEKDTWQCRGDTPQQCKEDPNSSTIELIWQGEYECPLGTECTLVEYAIGDYAMCLDIGECTVGAIQCTENHAQVLECIYDEVTGGGIWEIAEKCVAQGLKCWDYDHNPRCVPSDWVYCTDIDRFSCIKNYLVECVEGYHWEVVENCSDDNLTCAQDGSDWVCFDLCEYKCAKDRDQCETWVNGTVVYNAGECQDDKVCCKY